VKPKIFATCYNFNDACPNTQMIHKEFGEKIGLIEMKSPDDFDERNAVNLGKAVVEVSDSYCKDCDDFS